MDSCNYQAKKETLKILDELSEESSFSKAAEAVRSVILHGAWYADRVVAMFNRLNSDIVDLAPMVLLAAFLKCRQSDPTWAATTTCSSGRAKAVKPVLQAISQDRSPNL